MKKETTKDTVTFHHEKIHDFKTLHADGVMAAVTPSDLAFFAFYTERLPMPKRIVYEIDEAGHLMNAVDSDAKEGVFRELHSGIIMSLDALKVIHSTMGEILTALEKSKA